MKGINKLVNEINAKIGNVESYVSSYNDKIVDARKNIKSWEEEVDWLNEELKDYKRILGY